MDSVTVASITPDALSILAKRVEPAEFRKLDESILRASDIRGVFGATLYVEDAYMIGKAFGTILRDSKQTQVSVGYDGRLSSPLLAAALMSGLAACGVRVENIGLGPTPMLYFAAVTRTDGNGIMVTGSHNPAEYNGFKMMLGGEAFYGEGIERLGRLAAWGPLVDVHLADPTGTVVDRPASAAYIERLLEGSTCQRSLRVAWDPGNGAAGEVVKKLVSALPGHHILLNEEIDGTFPAHHPDPTIPQNLLQLRDTVVGKGCDLGVAFDGDGDRIGVVDSHGRILWGDQLLQIFAHEVLAEHPGAPIIADVKASQSLFDTVECLGGKAVMWKTGHAFIKSKMRELGAPLAGEMSGHIFFADKYYGFDDAIYAALRLIDLIARSRCSLAEWHDALPLAINTPEIRIDCSDDAKFDVIARLSEDLHAEGVVFNDIDGVRVTTADGWWLLRASNTQPVLVARVEARGAEGMARLHTELKHRLECCGVPLPPQHSMANPHL